MNSGEHQGDFEVPVAMLIQETDIPKGTVSQYDEFISADEKQTITIYIIKSEAVGQAPDIAMKHYLIPFFDDEGL